KGLLAVGGQEHVGEGQACGVEKGSEHRVAGRTTGRMRRKRPGGLPCWTTRRAEPRKASHGATVGWEGLPTRSCSCWVEKTQLRQREAAPIPCGRSRGRCAHSPSTGPRGSY